MTGMTVQDLLDANRKDQVRCRGIINQENEPETPLLKPLYCSA